MFSIKLLSIIVIATLAAEVCGNSVTSISLRGDQKYAQLKGRSTLQCNYDLPPGETLQKMGWFKDGVPVLTWSPPDDPYASASYRDRLDFTAQDGNLHIIQVETSDAGDFTCTLQSVSGHQQSSEPFSLVVADVPDFGFSMKKAVKDCQIVFSFVSPAVYPKPSAICGLWTPDNKFKNTATNWQAVPFHNGSVAYSVHNVTFPIGRGLVLKSGLRCELNILPSIQSPDVINVWQHTDYFQEISERGCPKLPVSANITVTYTNSRTTCRDEVTPRERSKPLVAALSCHNTTAPPDGPVLECSPDNKWEPKGSSWQHFEDITCQEGSMSGGVRDPYNSPVTLPPIAATVEELPSSATHHSNSCLALVLVVLAAILS